MARPVKDVVAEVEREHDRDPAPERGRDVGNREVIVEVDVAAEDQDFGEEGEELLQDSAA